MAALPPLGLSTETDDPEESADSLELNYELKIEGEQRRLSSLGEAADGGERERELGMEFTAGWLYPMTPSLTALVEGKVLIQSQWMDSERDWHTEKSLERGELWLRWQPNTDQDLALKLGRQEFTEPRQWWWDDDLDALRLDYEADRWTLAVALAKESAPRSTLEDDIHPAADDVVRVLGHISWTWLPDQRVAMFALYQNDRSLTPAVGATVEQNDAVDANLSWLGMRAIGDFKLGKYGSLAYWLDSAWVWGDEQIIEFDEEDNGLLVIDRYHRNVRGWALDIGGSWTLPMTGKPQLLFGYAFGSGDADPDNDKDRAFRQTGLQENEDRFHYYGELFNPELSNLHIFTVGVGWPLLEDSLLALVHHRYRQVEAADFLRETGIDRDPEGSDNDLGWEWDLVFEHTIEDKLSLKAIGSIFEAGRAFGNGDGKRAYRFYTELTYEF